MVVAAAGLAVLLAACGDSSEPEGDLFVRDVPDRPAPREPAPDFADLPQTPDLAADEKGVAMLCAVRDVGDEQTCACLAEAAAAQFNGRDLAYFSARMIGDEDEAGRLLSGRGVQERAELSNDVARLTLECGL